MKRYALKTEYIIALCFIAFVLLTNRWIPLSDGIALIGATDTQSYIAIAQSAPALPAQPLFFAHSQRFFYPWLAGCVHHYTGINLYASFLIVCSIGLVGAVIMLRKTLVALHVQDSYVHVLTLLYISIPYTIRYYLAVPAMLSDVYFMFGLTVLLYGMLKRNYALMLASAIIAGLGRQNIVVLIPSVIVFLMIDTAWQERFKNIVIRALQSVVFVGVAVGVYLTTNAIARQFSPLDDNLSIITTAYQFYGNPSHNHIKIIAEFLFRMVLPVLLILSIIVLLVSMLRKDLKSLLTDRTLMPIVLMFCSMAGFIFLTSPIDIMGNVTRYITHTIPVLIVLIAMLLKRAVPAMSVPPTTMYVLTGGLSLYSFHHMYTVFSLDSRYAPYYAVVSVALVVVISGVCIYAVRSYKNHSALSS